MTRTGKSRRLSTPVAVGIYALLLVVAASTAGCAPARRAVNVSEQASLAQASRLEIAERDTETPGQYVSRLSIEDPSILGQLSAALDVDLPLGPLVDCLAQYRLSFVPATGDMQVFDYYCAGGASFLTGAQAFWSGQQVRPPPEFDAILSNLLQAPDQSTRKHDSMSLLGLARTSPNGRR